MSISKKLRFEVFKRDGFQCQYCGKTPPDAILEADHINPKARKGKDDINNLITACFDCNRGKGAIPLNKIPNSLVDNLEILKEREIQIREYNRFLSKIESRIQKEIDEIDEVYNSYFSKWWFSENFKNVTLKRFLKHLPKQVVIDAMHLACHNMMRNSKYNPEDAAIKYFCGICWNRIRGNEEDGQG